MTVLKVSMVEKDGENIAQIKEQYNIIDDRWLDGSVGVVAVFDRYPYPHFTSYIGATEGIKHDDEKWLIAWKGNKITDERIARAIFPYINHPYKV